MNVFVQDISKTTGHIAGKFAVDFYAPQRMNSNHFAGRMFPLVPALGQIAYLCIRNIKIYWLPV